MAAKTIIASVGLEPELARAVEIVVDLQGSTVSAFFRGLARAEVIRLGVLENPINKYMPPTPAPAKAAAEA